LTCTAMRWECANMQMKNTRARFAPVDLVLTTVTAMHRRVKGGFREAPVFKGQHHEVVKASVRNEARVTLRHYLREGGPVSV
jgi:hypothetical protein